MPPRCAPNTDNQAEHNEDRQENAPPPPYGDDAIRALEGMIRFFEQQFQHAHRPQHDIYDQFWMLGPREFSGTTDPFDAEGWIRSLEIHFHYLNMGDADRVRCTTYIFRDDASLWWEGVEHGIDFATLTWVHFKETFYEKYFTTDVRGRLKREFMSLRQGDTTVAKFVRKFERDCHFVPLFARDATEKTRHFMDGIRPTIRRDVMMM
ncbi:uncharacterized protein LOC142537664 [Primulina tabacum]|uniref:uncharacterized protein LOC142537664 n=1 Tax=Primulina tabacum TaxID=48773 RepID=UPI003F599CF4